jgi:hypothetical protein
MALNPIIVVGCGGSGGAVVTALRTRIENLLRRSGWTEGVPDAWQFIWVDTPSGAEDKKEFGDPIPSADYVSLSQGVSKVQEVYDAVKLFLGQSRYEEMASWAPHPTAPVPINKGAGQWRAVGRLSALMSLQRLGDRIDVAWDKITRGQQQLSRLGGYLGTDAAVGQNLPLVFVVTSLAGGTGSGIFMDVCDIIRFKQPKLDQMIAGVLFTAEIFDDLGYPALQYNTVGALSELAASSYSHPSPFPRIFDGAINVPQRGDGHRGPFYSFVIGKKTLDGNSLSSTEDVYRSTTETLVALMTNPEIFRSFNEYFVGNWNSGAATTTHNPGFGKFLNWEAGDFPRNAFVSSFGSARLCVGSDLFAEYAAHRMTRELVDFLHGGFLDEGRQLMGNNQASGPEVLRWFKDRYGMSFVTECGLREVNLGAEEHNQILDRLMPEETLRNSKIEGFIAELQAQIASAITQNTSPGQVEARILELCPAAEPAFIASIEAELSANARRFMSEAPTQILDEVSRYMSRFGLPVAVEMVAYLDEHLETAARELEIEIQKLDDRGSHWREFVASEFAKLRPKDKIDGSHTYARNGCRAAANRAYGTAAVIVRKKAIELVQQLRRQVLESLALKLEQISALVSGKEGVNAVASWPQDDEVTDRFKPSPLDFCLIEPANWPLHYSQLLRQTVEQDDPTAGDTAEYVRKVVGAGGFRAQVFGSTAEAPRALFLAGDWTGTRPVEFSTNLRVEDILARARIWINREGTALGDFCNTRLRGYLASSVNGNPVPDHHARLARFQDALGQVLKMTKPLVQIDGNVYRTIHGTQSSQSMREVLSYEKMPFVGEDPAKKVAVDVLANSDEIRSATPAINLEDFFGSTSDPESVLFVALLNGPVHPAVLASVTSPIQSEWATSQTNGRLNSSVWQYRRARPLDEFIPVRSRVRQSLIRGWIIGRLLGIIEPPTSESAPTIPYKNRRVEFPWPTVVDHDFPRLASDPKKHIPAVLETLSVATLLMGMKPDMVLAYEGLYELGETAGDLLTDVVLNGKCSGQVESAAVVKMQQGVDMDAVESRKQALATRLKANLAENDPSKRNLDAYGADLVGEIRGQIEVLIRQLDDVSVGGGDF